MYELRVTGFGGQGIIRTGMIIGKALSLHGTEGRTELRDQIVAAYQGLLEVHPAMGGYVAKDLTGRGGLVQNIEVNPWYACI